MSESSAADERAIAGACASLARGEIVAFPTETFYGLAVDARNPEALARLIALKGRGVEKAFALIVGGRDMLASLCESLSPRALALIQAHWPGPLTLALPARPGLPAAIVADGYVAVRESPHPVARALVIAFGHPLTATSANRSGAAPPTTAAGVEAAFPTGCHILPGGDTPGGAPSTLVRVVGNRLQLLRPGAVSIAVD